MTKITPWMFGAGLFALVVVVVARLQSSSLIAFLLIFGLVAVLLLAYFAAVTETPDTTPDVTTRALPLGFGRALLEQMPSALILINDKGRITYCNTAANRLVPSLSHNKHFATLFRAPVFVEMVHDVLNDGAARSADFTLPGKDRVFQAQGRRLPQGSDFGEDSQVIVQIEDRTQDKRAEEMRSDFIANASHELRTPLASIMGYIETLQGHARNDPDAWDRFLGIMEKQAARMQRLVDDLMSLSRIELTAHMPPTEQADLNALVKEAAAALSIVAEKARVAVDVELTEDSHLVKGDPDQLQQVATNLIDNAIKYAQGGKVRVYEAEPNEKYPRMIGITVADEGPGISREHLHRLTERFYRVNVAQSRNVGGTGLGLAIVKHILNRHEGELQIASVEGEGSRFTFWIPT